MAEASVGLLLVILGLNPGQIMILSIRLYASVLAESPALVRPQSLGVNLRVI